MATANSWGSQDPAEVDKGGTGVSTLTDGGVILGSGTAAVTSLAQATNGQLVIGSTSADPVLSAITSTDGSLTVTNGAGSIVIEGTAASATQVGSVELATDAETNTGTSTILAITPANITAWTGDTALVTVGTITTGTWTATDIAAADGGTGRSSHTAYAVLCGGTTTTAAQQSIASVGTTGQVLTSTGASSLPTFQTAAAASGTGWVFLSSVTASADATVVMTSGIDTTYNRYMITITDLIPETDTAVLNMRTSTDGGATYDATAGDYAYLSTYNDNSGASSITSTSATFMTMTLSGGSGVGNGTGESLNSNIILCNPSAAVTYKKIFLSTIYTTAGAVYGTCTGSGVRLDTADIDAVQFLMSTGDITSGVFKLYGLTAS